jgi:ATP-binding cassette subfamily F protein 3
MMPGNFMLLDEPTNHLDLRAKDVLLEALREFTGTVVFVSHDRYFLDNLATRVFEVADGAVTDYPGNYEEYHWKKAQLASMGDGGQGAGAGVAKTAPAAEPEEKAAPAKRLNPIKLQQMQDRQNEIEEEVARLEAEIAGYESELANFKSAEETIRLTELLDARRKELDGRMAEWEEVSAAIQENA